MKLKSGTRTSLPRSQQQNMTESEQGGGNATLENRVAHLETRNTELQEQFRQTLQNLQAATAAATAASNAATAATTRNNNQTLNMNVYNNYAIISYMNALLVECRRSFSVILSNQGSRGQLSNHGSHGELTSIDWPSHTNERPGVGALVFLAELDALVWSWQFRVTVQRIRTSLIRNALYSMLLGDYDSFGHIVDRVRPIVTHNIYVNLFNRRVGKYMARGIDFTNLPPVIPHVMRILPRGL